MSGREPHGNMANRQHSGNHIACNNIAWQEERDKTVALYRNYLRARCSTYVHSAHFCATPYQAARGKVRKNGANAAPPMPVPRG